MKQENLVLESHGANHVKEVLQRANEINNYLYQTLGICGDKNILDYAARYHDIAAFLDRKNHHLVGASIFAKEYTGRLPMYIIKKITDSIKEHRASYKGDYSSLESQIISTADRDPISADSINDLYKRSYVYAREHGHTHEDAVDHAYHHIKEKYGIGGYAFNPNNKVFFIYYKEDLEKFWNAIDLVYPEFVYKLLFDMRDTKIEVKK